MTPSFTNVMKRLTGVPPRKRHSPTHACHMPAHSAAHQRHGRWLRIPDGQAAHEHLGRPVHAAVRSLRVCGGCVQQVWHAAAHPACRSPHCDMVGVRVRSQQECINFYTCSSLAVLLASKQVSGFQFSSDDSPVAGLHCSSYVHAAGVKPQMFCAVKQRNQPCSSCLTRNVLLGPPMLPPASPASSH